MQSHVGVAAEDLVVDCLDDHEHGVAREVLVGDSAEELLEGEAVSVGGPEEHRVIDLLVVRQPLP